MNLSKILDSRVHLVHILFYHFDCTFKKNRRKIFELAETSLGVELDNRSLIYIIKVYGITVLLPLKSTHFVFKRI